MKDAVIVGLLLCIVLIVIYRRVTSGFPSSSSPSSADVTQMVVQMLRENKKTSEIIISIKDLVPPSQLDSLFTQAQAQLAAERQNFGPIAR